MNTRSITEDQLAFEIPQAEGLSRRLWTLLAAIPVQFRNARLIEREAKLMYAMSNRELDELGISRETIPERLLATYGE